MIPRKKAFELFNFGLSIIKWIISAITMLKAAS